MNPFLLQFGLAFCTAMLAIVVCAPWVHKVGLVDVPDHRKTHSGAVPLIGGISIMLALLVTTLLLHSATPTTYYFLGIASLLVLVGALDDCGDLNVYFRIVVELIAANLMIFGAGVYVIQLGPLLGFDDIYMPFWAAYPFTLVAVFGILNAFNMIDGMDGLAGGLALIALMVLYIFTDDLTLAVGGPAMAGGLVAFLLCNLKLLPFLPKVFLGDAGSKLVGFCLVWWLISVTQDAPGHSANLPPVTALYLVGLPLIDMVTTTVRRLRKGISPFYPDHTHLHHILQRAGFGRRASLALILTLALWINLLGIALAYLSVPAVIQFALFFTLYWVYSHNVHRAWKLSKMLRKTR